MDIILRRCFAVAIENDDKIEWRTRGNRNEAKRKIRKETNFISSEKDKGW